MGMKNGRWALPGRTIALLCLAWMTQGAVAAPITLTNDLVFSTARQSAWGPGPNDLFVASAFVGGRYGDPASGQTADVKVGDVSCFDLGVGNACVGGEAGVRGYGQVGLRVSAQASGGDLSALVKTRFEVSLPQGPIKAGEAFQVSASGKVLDGSGLTLNSAQFQARINGEINMKNSLFGTACFGPCTSGSVDMGAYANFELVGMNTANDKPFSLFGQDFAMPPVDKPFELHSGPCVVRTNPLVCSFNPTPRVGEVTVFTSPDSFAGGVLNDGNITMAVNQKLLNFSASIPGLMEAAQGWPIDVLHQKASIPGLFGASYTLFDIEAGVNVGLQQELTLDPNLAVQLQYSRAVTVKEHRTRYAFTCEIPPDELRAPCKSGEVLYSDEANVIPKACRGIFGLNLRCSAGVREDYVADVLHQDGLVTVQAGETLDLVFDGGDTPGELLGRKYILLDPTIQHTSSASLDPSLRIQAMCASLELFNVADYSFCAVNENFATQDLFDSFARTDQFVLGGFDSHEFAAYASDSPTQDGGQHLPEPSTLLLLLAAGTAARCRVSSRKRSSARPS
jgi:hypothetical protein